MINSDKWYLVKLSRDGNTEILNWRIYIFMIIIFWDGKPTLSSPIISATMASDVTNIMEFPAPMMIVGA